MYTKQRVKHSSNHIKITEHWHQHTEMGIIKCLCTGDPLTQQPTVMKPTVEERCYKSFDIRLRHEDAGTQDKDTHVQSTADYESRAGVSVG